MNLALFIFFAVSTAFDIAMSARTIDGARVREGNWLLASKDGRLRLWLAVVIGVAGTIGIAYLFSRNPTIAAYAAGALGGIHVFLGARALAWRPR